MCRIKTKTGIVWHFQQNFMILMLAGSVFAEKSANDSLTILELEELLIRDIRARTTVSSTDIENRVQTSRTPDDLLKNMAGIDVRRTSTGGGKGGSVMIRGFDESRCLILLNGRPLNGSGVMGGDYVDWSTLSTEDIEKIEVIRGSKAAEYGNTLGGVINIVTKKGSEKLSTTVQSSYGMYNTLNAMAAHRGGLSRYFSYSLSAGRWQTEGYLRNNDVTRNNFGCNLSFKLPWEIMLEMGGRYTFQNRGFIINNQKGDTFYDSDYPESGEDAGGGPGVSWKLGNFYFGDGSYWDNTRTQYDVMLKKKTKNSEVEANAYTNNQDRTEYFYSITDKNDLVFERHSKPENNTWGWNLKAKQLVKRHYLKYGAEGVYLRYQSAETKKIDTSYFRMAPWSSTDQIESLTRHSVFAQDDWSLVDKITLSAGIRYDYFFGLREEGTSVPDYKIQGWSPKAGLLYAIWKGGLLEINAGRSYRFPGSPEYYWYYSGYQPPDSLDRKTLSPENAMQFEMGFSHEFNKKIRAEFRGYYYNVADYIRTIFGYRPSRVVYNIDRARLMGYELELSYRLLDHLTIFGNYSFQNTQKEGDILDISSELTDELSELPDHKANAGAEYTSENGALASLKMRFVGERRFLTGNSAMPGGAYLEEIGRFVTFDAHGAYPLVNKGGFKLKAQLGVENILNEKYEEIFNFPMPGVTATGGLLATF